MTFSLDNPATTIAVVGATDDPSKYGARIYRDLKAKGYRVYPVNPARDTVDGDPAYKSLADISESPDIVDIVVPPAVTVSVLKECASLGLRNIWVQPGAEDEAVVEALEAGDFDYVVGGRCIMVETTVLS